MSESEQFWFGLGIMLVVALTLLTVLVIRLLFIYLTRRRDQRHKRLMRAKHLIRVAAAPEVQDDFNDVRRRSKSRAAADRSRNSSKRAGKKRSHSDADRRHT
jgi:ABC-type transport system involved in cytochrome bd biosynthesis fused ATPase/permease subunit